MIEFVGASVKIRRYKCFGEKEGGFDQIKPINVIIGRNNSGKSALVDALALCVSKGKAFDPKLHGRGTTDFELVVTTVLSEPSLRRVFREEISGGDLPQFTNHWEFGKRLVGEKITYTVGKDWKPTLMSLPDSHLSQVRGDSVAANSEWPFENFEFLRVAAERDVRPEGRTTQLSVSPNGAGTTNLIRGFINQDNLPRHEVEHSLLSDLNEIYAGDSEFQRISCREDEGGTWEIFLQEETKGEIRLSQSGSSLKSIFIVLSFLRLLPHLKNVDWRKVIFAVEEPENNLHPALLRRLLNFLAGKQQERGFILVLTTHSSVGIDWASRRADCQIIHVQNVLGNAIAVTSTEYITNRAILDDLDIRASDMLQANGVIWIEGPSDRIYIRRWIDLHTSGELKEGVHYSMMFYGGRLLSHLESTAPDQNSELISVLSLNRNSAVIIDSDRHLGKKAIEGHRAKKPRLNINDTKKRIQKEVQDMQGFVWITEGREIENYIPNSVYERVVGNGSFTAGIYDEIPEHPYLAPFYKNKIELAHAVANSLKLADLSDHLDLEKQVSSLVRHIKIWNGMIA